jgi:hypothetical protein
METKSETISKWLNIGDDRVTSQRTLIAREYWLRGAMEMREDQKTMSTLKNGR